MRYLIEYANREVVSGVIDRAMGFDIVHGVVVQLDPSWLMLWRLCHSLTVSDWKSLDHELPHYMEEWEMRMRWRWPWFGALQMGLSQVLSSWDIGQLTPVALDPTWTCNTWEYITRRRDRALREPFVLNVLVAPRSSRGTFEELASSLGEGSEQIRFEARPIGRAYSSRKELVRPLQGGISLGTDTGGYGTLGGFLRNKKGDLYAVTCGHAIRKNDEAKQPSPRDARSAIRIGVCVESTDGTLHGPASRCNRKAAVNEVDAALIELDKDSQITAKCEIMGIGNLARWAAIDDVDEDSPIQVSGRSGQRSLYTGHLLAVGSLRIGEDKYCFKNLLEIKRASVRNWGVTGTLAPPVHPGDSGAWVVQDGAEGPEWCAMVVGGSGPVGYAVFAENILDWLKSKHYGSLSIA